MSKLLRYLKKYKIESILAPFFKLIEVAFELIVPLIVSTIIDIGIENGDKVYIIKRCLLLGLFGILGISRRKRQSASLSISATRSSSISASSLIPSSIRSARRRL